MKNNTHQAGGKSRRSPFVVILTWVVVNALIALCAWTAVNGNDGIGRLFIVASFVLNIPIFLIGFSDELGEKCRKQGRIIPARLSGLFKIAMIIFLIWHGWWFTALTYLLSLAGETMLFSNPTSQ